MFGLGMPELILILVIALVIFGAKNLPGIGKALGQTVHEVRKATTLEPDKPDREKSGDQQARQDEQIKK